MALLESLDETTDSAINRTEEFLRSSEAYYELKLFQMLSSSISLIVKFTLIGGLGVIALILFAVAISTAIGQSLDSSVLGYVITAGIFLCLGLLIFLIRKKIENSIIRVLSKKVFN